MLKRYRRYFSKIPYSAWQAWATLLVTLMLTLWAWHLAKMDSLRAAEEQFNFRVEEIKLAVEKRMIAYEQVLRGAAGFLDASQEVTRDEWRRYVQRLKLEQNYPGIQGLAFIPYLTLRDKELHVRQVKAQGLIDYQIRPAGERAEYNPIMYIEPSVGPNSRAFGFDLSSEPVRRTALHQARDAGSTVVTPKVTLVQETTEKAQAGFGMYLPVYKGGIVPSSIAQRRALLRGYVASPFRMNDLMQGILGERLPDIALEIYDGEVLSGPLMYNSARESVPRIKQDVAFSSVIRMNVHGRPWILRFTSQPTFKTIIDTEKPRIVLLAGLLISVLFFAVVRSLATRRVRALALAKDMTAALRKSEERFQVALKHSSIVVFSQDTELRYTWIYNAPPPYSPAEAIGKTDFDLQPFDVATQLTAIKREVLRTGLPAYGEIEVFLTDGPAYFQYNVEPLREPDGTVIGVTGSAIDVTSIKLVQRELSESEEKFKAVFESAAIGMAVTDTSHRIIAANPQWQRMLGYSEGEVNSLTLEEYVYSEDLAESALLFKALIDEKQSSVKQRKRYICKDGRIITANLTMSLIRSRDDSPILAIKMIEDITELNKAEMALRQAYSELEQRVNERTAELQERTRDLERSNSELQQFAYVASHDLKEPLRVVASFAQLLKQRYYEKLGDGKEFCDFIYEGASRMQQLIDDLLKFSQVGKRPKALNPVDCNHVLKETISNLQISIDESGAEITSDNLPTVSADDVQLVQLFQNLIANGIKFHGELPPKIHIGANELTAEWEFFVQDNGIGIDPEHFNRIFIIFQRLHTRTEYQGSGIGLAICKKIVERHGGRIWVESIKSAGAKFLFTIPKRS